MDRHRLLPAQERQSLLFSPGYLGRAYWVVRLRAPRRLTLVTRERFSGLSINCALSVVRGTIKDFSPGRPALLRTVSLVWEKRWQKTRKESKSLPF
jgi:hypothetical protein